MNWHLERGEEVENAILDGGAREIALPAFVSTLAICIVFVPMFMLAGIARFLFVAARGGGGLCNAGLVPAVADAGGRRSPSTGCSGRDPDAPHRARGFLGRLQAALRAGAFCVGATITVRWLERALSKGNAASPCRSCSPWRRRRSWRFPMGRYLPGLGQELLSEAWTAGRSGCTCGRARGCASTRRRPCCDRVEDTVRSIIPGQGTRRHRRQTSACPYKRHQSDLLHLGAHRPERRRHLRELEPRPSSDR